MKPPTHADARGLRPPLPWAAHTPDSTMDSSSWAFLLCVIPGCANLHLAGQHLRRPPAITTPHRTPPCGAALRATICAKRLALNPPPLPPRLSSTAAWRGACAFTAALDAVAVARSASPNRYLLDAPAPRDWQNTHSGTRFIYRHQRPVLKGGFVGAKSRNDQGLQVGRGDILGSNLKDARSFGTGGSENRTEVEVVCEDDMLCCLRPRHDLWVGGPGIAHARPVHGIGPVALKNRDPLRGQVHVNDQLHGTESGTSISSARQAAYDSAWRMSSGSRYG